MTAATLADGSELLEKFLVDYQVTTGAALGGISEPIDRDAKGTADQITPLAFPHTKLDPSAPFDPFNAVARDYHGNYIHIDEDYLLANLHERPTMEMANISWKPREIMPMESCSLAMLDIESEGNNPEVDRVTMIGVSLRGANHRTAPKKMQEAFAYAAMGGIIFTYSTESHSSPKLGAEIELMPDGTPYRVVYCQNEAAALKRFWMFLEAVFPTVISTHFGFEFDLPFLARRSDILGVEHPLVRIITTNRITGKPEKLMVSSASIDGKAPTYYPIYWGQLNNKGNFWNDGTNPQFFDSYIGSGQYDKLNGVLEGYGLKYLAADFIKGRDEHRLELSYQQMLKCWTDGTEEGLRKYRQYLVYDLEDQWIVTKFFLPGGWAQQMFIPKLPLQDLMLASPAKKWNSILSDIYKPLEGKKIRQVYNGVARTVTVQKPGRDEKASYEGAISRASRGLYRRGFYKVDVASLYPSIILRWLLCPRDKDPIGMLMFILLQARALRYTYKALGNNTTDKALKLFYKAVDSALKVLLNGGFGFYGTGGYPYNCMATSALITAYGRILMRIMMEVAGRYHKILEVDTDGLIIEPSLHSGPADFECELFTRDLLSKLEALPQDDETAKKVAYFQGQLDVMLDESLGERLIYTPEFVHNRIQQAMPSGDPEAEGGLAAVGIVLDLEVNCPEGAAYIPAPKNYIMMSSEDAKPKVKGLYRKRNRTPLQKTHLIEYIRLRAFKGPEAAGQYRNAVINAIRQLSFELAEQHEAGSGQVFERLEAGEYAVHLTLRDVLIRQKIGDHLVWLVKCNLGYAGDNIKHIYYWGHIKQRGKSTKNNPLGKFIKGKEFPIRVTEDENGNIAIDPQYFPDHIDQSLIQWGLDPIKYEGDFLKSIAKIDDVIAAGEARTSNYIEDDDLPLQEWFKDSVFDHLVPF